MNKLKTILKSLYSNQACIDARKYPWYFAVIVFILAVFLPWIPGLSKGYTANTAALMTSTGNYELDKGFKQVLVSDYFKNGITVKSSEGKYILYYDLNEYSSGEAGAFAEEYNGTNAKALYKGTFSDISGGSSNISSTTAYSKEYSNKVYDYYFDNISVSTTGSMDFPATSSTSSSIEYENTGRTTYLEAFYIPELSLDDEKYSMWLNNFVTSVILNIGSDGKANSYPHSYTIWAKDFVMIAVYPLKSSKSSLSVAGSYTGIINDGFDGETIADGTTLYSYLAKDQGNDVLKIYEKGLSVYFNHAGRPRYLKSVWTQVGILSAIVAGSVLVCAVLLFLFSKSKSSIYRDSTNFWNAIAEGCYMMLTPSLIGMIFGFFSSQYVMVALIGAILFRTVFARSKICPPPMDNGNGGNKPLYQARS